MNFDLIYQTYFEDVFLYLRGLSNSETIAEEITQETFMKALKALDRFDGSKDIKAWLFTIAKNTYFTYCKRQKLFLEIVIVDNIAAPQSDFTLRVEDEESAFCIHQFLRRFTKGYYIKQPNMDCQPTEFTALSRHRAVFSWAGKGGIPICGA